MSKVYVLLEKDLRSGFVRVEGVYATRELADFVQDSLMDIFEEKKSYKIVRKFLNQ